jgi:hypothetical protein
VQEKAKLAREVEDLNNTVFSKSFKAPSAWAEREVKYKMEKRDWDSQGIKLRDAIAKLEAENARYRAENKAAEFEAQIQVRQLGHFVLLPINSFRVLSLYTCSTGRQLACQMIVALFQVTVHALSWQ